MAVRWIFDAFDSGKVLAANSAELLQLVSSRRGVAAFDDTTAETIYLESTAPSGLTGTITCSATGFMASAESGSIVVQVQVEAFSEGDNSASMVTACSFDTSNSALGGVPASAGVWLTVPQTLTDNDSMAAGDSVRFAITRLVGHASDNATGDWYLKSFLVADGS